MQRIMILGLLGCLLVAACADSVSVEEQLGTWSKAGLEPTAFETAKRSDLGCENCFSGKVSGVHVALCNCPDEEAAAKATDAGRKSIGNATGVALARGATLMIAVDRDNIDPNGRTINKLSKVFWTGESNE